MTRGGPIPVKIAGPNLKQPEHYWEKDEYIYGSLAARAMGVYVQYHFCPNNKGKHTHTGVINTERVITTGKELMPCLFPDNHPNFGGKREGWDVNQIICAYCDVHWTLHGHVAVAEMRKLGPGGLNVNSTESHHIDAHVEAFNQRYYRYEDFYMLLSQPHCQVPGGWDSANTWGMKKLVLLDKTRPHHYSKDKQDFIKKYSKMDKELGSEV